MQTRRDQHLLYAALAMCAAVVGCGGGSSSPLPPPPNPITVSVSPSTASLFLGQTQQFTATLTNTSNTAVTWSVNSVNGGNATVGTISSAGLYTAPQNLPSPASVTVTATSQADSSKSASAGVTLKSDVAVNVTPPTASVPTRATQPFSASVTGSGNPNKAVTWSVNGVNGGNMTVGTISSAGLYAAPALLPSPPTVTVTATSVADAAKSNSASVTITCATPVSVSPSAASVPLGQQQQFSAAVCFTTDQSVTWDVNGVVGGNSTVGTITTTGLYTAPASLPPTNPVTVRATSLPDSTKSGTATVTVASSISVVVSPSSATLAANHRQTFSATLTNTSNQAVTWTVNGVVNGNSTVGQICLTGSSPCTPPAVPATGSVDYLAPASIPAPNPVTVTATSQADTSRSGSSQVMVIAHVQVSVSPATAFVAPNFSQSFSATVIGTSNQGVTWSISSAVPGQGCTGSACGSVTSTGLYTAPAQAPSPNAISVTATSQEDTTQSGSSSVALTNGVVIQSLQPASVTAGVANSFMLQVTGLNFVAGTGSSASTMLVNGTPRTTVCASSTTQCTTTLQPSDVASPGNVQIQMQNPNSNLSNPVSVVVVAAPGTEDIIRLSSSTPLATSKDILAVEPTTAGTAGATQINIDLIGVFSGSTCTAQGGSITLVRPLSGSATIDICIHGNDLDATLTYTITGPSPNDISISPFVLSSANFVGIHVTLSSGTLPGARTLFVENANHDKAATSGAIEVR